MYKLQTHLLVRFFAFTCYTLFPFLILHFHQEWEMLINFNEIDICINRLENTKGAYLFHSFQVPRCFTPQKNFITVTQSLLERLLPPSPPFSSLHWFLLYVIEIETSITLSLLLGTKESDIFEWRIPLRFKPLDLITPILHLYYRNSISVSNYVQVSFAQFVSHIQTTCHRLAVLPSAMFT